MHCNFLLNTGKATGHDLELLGETVRARVLKNSGVRLQWRSRGSENSEGASPDVDAGSKVTPPKPPRDPHPPIGGGENERAA
jgi:hypothetical protein